MKNNFLFLAYRPKIILVLTKKTKGGCYGIH